MKKYRAIVGITIDATEKAKEQRFEPGDIVPNPDAWLIEQCLVVPEEAIDAKAPSTTTKKVKS